MKAVKPLFARVIMLSHRIYNRETCPLNFSHFVVVFESKDLNLNTIVIVKF